MKETLASVSPSEIHLTGWNPREEIKGEKLEELKTSITNEGGIQIRLIVRKAEKGYELISGERRLKAAKELKLKEVPVIIREATDEEVRVVMLVENLQREDLTPLEEASGLQGLIDMGRDPKDLAKRVGKSETWVRERLKLLEAPEELRTMMREGDLQATHVLAVMPYAEREELRIEVIKDLKQQMKMRGGLTVERAEECAYSALESVGENLDLNDYEYEGLYKFFDFSKCMGGCPHFFELSKKGKKTERHCLDNDCFLGQIEAARVKLDEAEQKKAAKAGSKAVSGSKFNYQSDRDLADASFNVEVICKDCPNRVLKKPEYQSFGKAKGEKNDTCTKSSCFQGKTAQETRRQHAKCKEELAGVDESFKKYLDKRTSPLTEKELAYLIEQFNANKTKKGAEVKDLENSLLTKALEHDLEDVRRGLNFTHLRQLEPSWPFKVAKVEHSEDAKKGPKKGAS
jgi:ParB family chromosome partitioning protein